MPHREAGSGHEPSGSVRLTLDLGILSGFTPHARGGLAQQEAGLVAQESSPHMRVEGLYLEYAQQAPE